MVKAEIAVATLACSFLACGAAFAAQIVVLDAKGALAGKMAPGTVLDDQSVDVPARAELTVMGADGQAIRVVGPHQGPIGAAAAATGGNAVAALAAMIGNSERNATYGATRGVAFVPAPAAGPTDPWLVNATEGGTACVFGGHAPMLWKPASAAAVRLTIENDATRQSAGTDWPAGTAALAWPKSIPAADGARYTVSLGPDGRRTITLKLLPAAASPGAAAIAAAAAGCTGQSRLLLKQVKATRTVAP